MPRLVFRQDGVVRYHSTRQDSVVRYQPTAETQLWQCLKVSTKTIVDSRACLPTSRLKPDKQTTERCSTAPNGNSGEKLKGNFLPDRPKTTCETRPMWRRKEAPSATKNNFQENQALGTGRGRANGMASVRCQIGSEYDEKSSVKRQGLEARPSTSTDSSARRYLASAAYGRTLRSNNFTTSKSRPSTTPEFRDPARTLTADSRTLTADSRKLTADLSLAKRWASNRQKKTEFSTTYPSLCDPCYDQIASRLYDYLLHDDTEMFLASIYSVDMATRQQLVNIRPDQSPSSSIFFSACQLTRMHLIDLMLKDCLPDLELTGTCTLPDGSTAHQVTPLWFAAASGNVDLTRLLLKFRANVNTTSPTGSSAVMAACCVPHVETVSLLVSHGADIHAKNMHGVTCLMNAVLNTQLVRLLVRHGAKINDADLSGNTALHYATEVGSMEIVMFLVEKGANPFILNNDNINVIQTAAKHRHRAIVEYLLSVTAPKISEIVDAYIVLGAMTIILDSDFTNGVVYWVKALTLRRINPSLLPQPQVKNSILTECFNVKEITTPEELTRLTSDHDALCVQALLMYERVRGCLHENFINLLMYRGAVSADEDKFLQAVTLWRAAYKLHLQKYLDRRLELQPFNRNIMRNLQFLVKVLFHAWTVRNTGHHPVRQNDQSCIPEVIVRDVFGLTCQHISYVCDDNSSFKNEDNFYLLLKCCLCLFLFYLENYTAEERSVDFGKCLQSLVSINPLGVRGQSLLHMCLDKDTLEPLEWDGSNGQFWPSRAMVEILLLFGADPRAQDTEGDTPIHYLTHLYNKGVQVDQALLKVLLTFRGHVDQVNYQGQTAVDLLHADVSVRAHLQTISLRCLAARVVATHGLSYVGEVPVSLYSFIELHATRPRLH